MSDILLITVEYILRRDRISHPSGNFDKKGRWYPSEKETASCCSDIRAPSNSFPYSLMIHCRTIKHVATLYGCEVSDIRKNLSVKKFPLLMGLHPHVDELIKKHMTTSFGGVVQNGRIT